MRENIQIIQEIVKKTIKDCEKEAEILTEQKHDIKIYNTNNKILSSRESTQESRKAKTSHLGKDWTMLK